MCRRIGLGLLCALAVLAGASVAMGRPPQDLLTDPKIVGTILFQKGETIDNNTDDIVKFTGQNGTNDTDVTFDLDEAAGPKIYVTTAGDKLRFADDLAFTAAAEVTTEAGNLTLSPAADLILTPTGGDVDFTADMLFTLGAAQKCYIDATTTAHTDTAGALDVNMSTITAGATGFDLGVTMANGTASGANVYGQQIVLTANDADGDMFGLLIAGVATDNAGASSYEYLLGLDNRENTAGAVPDALLITDSGGVGGGVIDAIDASSTNITNALNVGPNTVTGTTWLAEATTALTLGDAATGTNGATVAIFSSDWEIGTTGNVSGLGTVTADGDVDLTAAGGGSGTADLDVAGYAQFAGTIEVDGALDADGAITLGDGGDTLIVDTSDWDITATGDLSGIGTIAADGDVDLTAAGGGTGTADLDVAGYAQFAGTIEVDGALDADGAITLGDGGDTLIINTSDWDVTATGDLSGIGTIAADGDVDLTAVGGGTGTADFDVAGYAQFAGAVEIDGALQADGKVTFNAGSSGLRSQLSFFVVGDLDVDDGPQTMGCMVGLCTISTSTTNAQANVTHFYVDDDAETAAITGTDDVTDANDFGGADDGDVATFANAAAEAINDGIYIGSDKRFAAFYVDLNGGTAATWSAAGGKWQYATADDTWADLTVHSDGTISANDSFEQSGYVYFTPPADWTVATGGTKAIVSGYYVRFILTAANVTQVAILDGIRIVHGDISEDLPQVRAAGQVDGISVQAQGVANADTIIVVENATQRTLRYVTVANGKAADRETVGSPLTFAAGDELAIYTLVTGATELADANVILEYVTQ